MHGEIGAARLREMQVAGVRVGRADIACNDCRGVVETFLAPFASLPFGDEAADRYAQIRRELEQRGLPIGAYDMQIAAITIAAGLTLVTHNVGEFSRISVLLLEDWQAA